MMKRWKMFVAVIIALNANLVFAAEPAAKSDANGIYTEDKQNILVTASQPVLLLN